MLQWAGHAWRSQKPLIRTVKEGYILLGKECWEATSEMGGHVKALGGDKTRGKDVCRNSPSGRVYRRRRIL